MKYQISKNSILLCGSICMVVFNQFSNSMFYDDLWPMDGSNCMFRVHKCTISLRLFLEKIVKDQIIRKKDSKRNIIIHK